MVEVTVAWVVELERAHANVVEGLVVDAEGLVRVLDELVDGESRVVRLHDSVGDFWRRDDGESGHHAVWEFLADLADEERTHAGAGATAEGVRDLETLQTVAALSLTTNDIEHLVDKLGALGVVTLRPVVAGARLAEDEVVRTEKLAEWASADGVHGAWLEINENRTRDILVAGGLVHVLMGSLGVFALG